MEFEAAPQESILDQILDEVFNVVGALQVFDPHVIQHLRRLAAAGDLRKPALVAQAIKGVQGSADETA